MKGLKKLLKDKTLFREYVEFCKNECCVENTLFYKEYHTFKDAIYKYSNRKNQDNSISISTLIVDDQDITTLYNDSSATTSYGNSTKYSNNDNSNNISSTNNNSNFIDYSSSSQYNSKYNKINLSSILKMAQNIIEKFILPNSEYEISVDNKISKKVITTFNKYKEMDSNNSLFIEDFENSDLTSIFDDAYEEVLTNLYLNTYLKYIKKGLKD
ncbi:hypothetical protein PIROE2DRAFT_2476 [Piromyces sp. E2]|nr:hypothetical protein PIROE2DRAFT_2476 [Piromyces sp. E2]|eukprot:OUM69608.1 hypothetical protein PIROE2DRAFT_2476 [Piromyces sp. E2]